MIALILLVFVEVPVRIEIAIDIQREEGKKEIALLKHQMEQAHATQPQVESAEGTAARIRYTYAEAVAAWTNSIEANPEGATLYVEDKQSHCLPGVAA